MLQNGKNSFRIYDGGDKLNRLDKINKIKELSKGMSKEQIFDMLIYKVPDFWLEHIIEKIKR